MKYKVKNMSCMHCVKRIETALKQNGITAKVSLETKTVEGDDARIPATLKAIGYDCE